jgi:hypothetical protein
MIQNLSTKNIWKSSSATIKLISLPLIFTSIISFLFYPGLMSYDTLHALRGARGDISDSIWPPMVSYVWRFIDLFSTNPASMHFFQVFMLLASIAASINCLFKKKKYVFFFLLSYLSIPAILGTLAVIWKDVLMAAFFISAYATTLLLKQIESIKLSSIVFFATLILLLLGTCSRHNAITAAVPLFFFLTYTFFTKFKFNSLKSISFSILSGLLYRILLS